MLSYSAHETPSGLRVKFHQKWNLRAMFVSFLLGALCVVIALHIRFRPTIGNDFGPLLINLGLVIELLFLILFFTICAVIILSHIFRKHFVFQKDGIRVANDFLGLLPVRSRFIPASQIYWFGVDDLYETSTKVLKFAAAGERSWIVLASNVSISEGTSFIEGLARQGLIYQTSRAEP